MTSHLRCEIAEHPAAVAATLVAVAEPEAALAAAVRERCLDRDPGRPPGLTKVTRTH